MQCEATMRAAQAAGIGHVGLVQEPIAAAMASIADRQGRNSTVKDGQFAADTETTIAHQMGQIPCKGRQCSSNGGSLSSNTIKIGACGLEKGKPISGRPTRRSTPSASF
jgi:hypothetical protein